MVGPGHIVKGVARFSDNGADSILLGVRASGLPMNAIVLKVCLLEAAGFCLKSDESWTNAGGRRYKQRRACRRQRCGIDKTCNVITADA